MCGGSSFRYVLELLDRLARPSSASSLTKNGFSYVQLSGTSSFQRLLSLQVKWGVVCPLRPRSSRPLD